MSNIPNSRPKASLERVNKAIKEIQFLKDDSTIVVGVRGYYLDIMGVKGKNDRGIYDDAIFIVNPSHFSSYNANTDPSVFRKGIATLAKGLHRYRPGQHGSSRPGGGYPAFRPATKNEELPVTRDGIASPEPGVAINIHKGGYGTTSSLGCQTIHPSQWDEFQAQLMKQLKAYGQKEFWYLLIDESDLPA